MLVLRLVLWSGRRRGEKVGAKASKHRSDTVYNVCVLLQSKNKKLIHIKPHA